MKKMNIAFALLASLGLAACAAQTQNAQTKGTVVSSQYEGEQLKLVVQKDNCQANSSAEQIEITQPYDSNIVVGACVVISEQGTSNVSRSVSRSVLSRTEIFH